jgi:predicted dehydrogenase
MKFLICGVGSIGSRHIRNIIELGYSDIILLRTGKSILPSLAEFSKFPMFYDIDEALAQKPDICVISNPTSMHMETAIAAAQNGCHLFIEKPLACDLDRVDELESIVESKKLTTLVTYQFRYHPHIKLIKKLLRATDRYGAAIYASAEWSEYLPDWHPWEDYRKSYAANVDLGGGVLLTQIHPLNYLNFLFGDINKTLVQKHATKSLSIDVDDTADILIEFASGVSGHVHIDFIQKPRVHKLKIVTNLGRFEWDCHQNKLIFLAMDGTIETFDDLGFERNDMFLEMLSTFIEDVKSGRPSDFGVAQAVAELKLLLIN